LRERPEDIHLLFRKFAADFAERYKTSPVRLDDQAQLILENYTWPGNIRELKNIAEQISALSEDKIITGEQLLSFIPNALKRNLPALPSQHETNTSDATGFYEREILFKFLYEMKKDLADVKSLISELALTNNLQMPNHNTATNSTPFKPMQGFTSNNSTTNFENDNFENTFESDHIPSNPLVINSNVAKRENNFSDVEEIEESLSLEDMERELIKKALKKHRGRRKEAARELGISERTLYRKIRQYGIEA
jgi:DNA-binding NtrC family response regulator